MGSNKTCMNEEPVVHLLAQEAYHDPAVIVGNREGIANLRDLLDALVDGVDLAGVEKVSGSIQVFCNDGEGYPITAAIRPDVSDMPLGYTLDFAKDNAPHPEWLEKAILDAEGGNSIG